MFPTYTHDSEARFTSLRRLQPRGADKHILKIGTLFISLCSINCTLSLDPSPHLRQLLLYLLDLRIRRQLPPPRRARGV